MSTKDTTAIELVKDEILEAAKRESQQRSHELVRSGKRTPESNWWFSPETARKLKIEHRWTDFEDLIEHDECAKKTIK